MPDADAVPAAIKRLQRALGLTDAEMELASVLPSGHWTELGKRSTEDLAATADQLTEMAAAWVTAKGHAEGWLPPDFHVAYTRVVWQGTAEPPPHVVRVRNIASGQVAVRAGDLTTPWGHMPAGTCDNCGPPGTWWTWLHNGNSECWLELDGIGPFIEVR